MQENHGTLLPLIYHDIETGNLEFDRVAAEDSPYVLSGATFDTHLRHLKNKGFESLTSAGLVDIVQGERLGPQRGVFITFDDGHVSNYLKALPALERFGYQGIFFITTSWIGNPNMLSWEQIRELHTRGMEIGSHTVTHPIPPTASQEDLRKELLESKETLEGELGISVRSISSPTGFHDPRMRTLAAEVGYEVLYVGTTSLRRETWHDVNPLWVNRLDMKASVSEAVFQGLVDGRWWPRFRLQLNEWLLGLLKDVMGPRRYNRLRSLLLGRRQRQEKSEQY